MNKQKFTLIEILAVTALIVILACAGIAVYSYSATAAKESATKATIARLTNGLTVLQDKGLLVKSSDSDGTIKFAAVKFDAANRKIVLMNSPERPCGGTARHEEAYKLFVKAIDADTVDAILDGSGRFCDGWGQPILLRFPGKFNKGGFDLVSPGEDGTFGADEAGTPPVDIAKYRDGDGDALCDDIVNF